MSKHKPRTWMLSSSLVKHQYTSASIWDRASTLRRDTTSTTAPSPSTPPKCSARKTRMSGVMRSFMPCT